MTCKAKVIGDQHICDRCGLAWDNNDPDPPVCNEAAPVCQKCFDVVATMQDDEGTYLCSECRWMTE